MHRLTCRNRPHGGSVGVDAATGSAFAAFLGLPITTGWIGIAADLGTGISPIASQPFAGGDGGSYSADARPARRTDRTDREETGPDDDGVPAEPDPDRELVDA